MSKQEIIPAESKWAIVMKNGLVFWVGEETSNRASQHLVNQSGHSFLTIAELGETINTAEIEGIYSFAKFDEMQRVKVGDWKCPWGKWHMKKERCECKLEADRKAAQELENKKRQDEANRPPPTPEQRIEGESRKRYVMEEGALSGNSFSRSLFMPDAKNRRSMRRSSVQKWEAENPGKEADLSNILIEEDVI